MLCLLVYTKSGHQRFKHAHHRFTREDKERGGNCTTIWFDQVSDCFINFNRVGWEMELLLCPAHKEAAWQDEHSLEPKNSASFDDGLESSENEVALPAKLVPKTLKVRSNWSSVKLICCQNKEIATMLFSSFLSEFWQISRLPGFASYFFEWPKSLSQWHWVLFPLQFYGLQSCQPVLMNAIDWLKFEFLCSILKVYAKIILWKQHLRKERVTYKDASASLWILTKLRTKKSLLLNRKQSAKKRIMILLMALVVAPINAEGNAGDWDSMAQAPKYHLLLTVKDFDFHNKAEI